ncbi:hypothetical protein SPHINGO8BC_150449 [Sphingobacterium multivorum]|uniref:Uncharacterized protein n=1 Tax=Sphingobacterium multivorum TaxID=28454 RepID=A0A654AJS4_SPHMU|nr:hypothetical protein SPHINGO8BC_150449 [Sphingobacterium multivorum]
MNTGSGTFKFTANSAHKKSVHEERFFYRGDYWVRTSDPYLVEVVL